MLKYSTLKSILNLNVVYNTIVGDEGGFAPSCNGTEERFELLLEAIKKAGLEPGKDVYPRIGLCFF